jgi:hypothetical protein
MESLLGGVNTEEVLWGILGVIGFLFYFAPSILAVLGNNDSAGGVIVVNIFLGWTFIGWVIALVWTLSGPKSKRVIRKRTSDADQLEKLARLKDRGHLSEKEFNSQKKKLLNMDI